MSTNSLTMSASHVVRLYLWYKLKEHLGDLWEKIETPAGLAIPIIPAQEQPESQTSDRPYIVYIYDYNSTTDLFQYQNETLVLRIYSQSPATIAATTKLIVRLLNKFDITAQEINDWIRDDSDSGIGRFYIEGDQKTLPSTPRPAWADEVKNFIFKTVRVAGVQGTQPANAEGSRVDSLVTIDLTYVEKDMSLG